VFPGVFLCAYGEYVCVCVCVSVRSTKTHLGVLITLPRINVTVESAEKCCHFVCGDKKRPVSLCLEGVCTK
jgi:hypothetical protein